MAHGVVQPCQATRSALTQQAAPDRLCKSLFGEYDTDRLGHGSDRLAASHQVVPFDSVFVLQRLTDI